MKKRWEYNGVAAEERSLLQKATGLDQLFCQLLLQREIKDAAEATHFFEPTISQLHDPFLMKDMYQAVGRINKAIEEEEPILIYGDYDVDGVCSVSMMYTFLKKYHPKLSYYIPDRYSEGYGVSMKGIHFAIKQEAKLIITVDCGIQAVDQIAFAKKQGIDVIICDHHLPGKHLPVAQSILNPQQQNCKYPFKSLCGCGVAFKLVQAISLANGFSTEEQLELLDFVAIATTCDIVPLLDENRVFVAFGIKQIEAAKREGFHALLQVSQRGSPLTVSDLVFGLGPMINAAGRLGDAKEAVLLLLSQNEEEANNQAIYLHQQNENRKAIDQKTVKEAIFLMEKENAENKSIVLFQSQWHKGIVGIAASRLVERFHKPTIILAQSAGVAVGSARSISGVDINKLIGQCADLLTNFGGHKHAAGLTLAIENIPAFKQRIEEQLQDQELAAPHVTISALLPLEKINFDFYETLQQFAPFGPKNRNPVFATEGVSLYGNPRLLKKSHLQFKVSNNLGVTFKCIAFNQADALSILQEENSFDICYNLQENIWNGTRSLQLNIKDIRRRGKGLTINS